MYLILFLFLLLVIAIARKGNKMLFSLILCDSFLAPVVGFIFPSTSFALGPCVGRSFGAKVPEKGSFISSVFCTVLPCYTVAVQGLLSLWLVLEYVRFCSFASFHWGLLASKCAEAAKVSTCRCRDLCSAEQVREARSAEAEAVTAAQAFLSTESFHSHIVIPFHGLAQPNASSVSDAMSTLDGLYQIPMKVASQHHSWQYLCFLLCVGNTFFCTAC